MPREITFDLSNAADLRTIDILDECLSLLNCYPQRNTLLCGHLAGYLVYNEDTAEDFARGIIGAGLDVASLLVVALFKAVEYEKKKEDAEAAGDG